MNIVLAVRFSSESQAKLDVCAGRCMANLNCIQPFIELPLLKILLYEWGNCNGQAFCEMRAKHSCIGG